MAKLTISLSERAYILKEERDLPTEEQTIFYLRPLKYKEREDLSNNSITSLVNTSGPMNDRQAMMRHNIGTQARMCIDKGLVRVENLKDHEGKDLAYTSDMPARARENVLDLMPPSMTQELADEIQKLSGLTKDDEKK